MAFDHALLLQATALVLFELPDKNCKINTLISYNK